MHSTTFAAAAATLVASAAAVDTIRIINQCDKPYYGWAIHNGDRDNTDRIGKLTDYESRFEKGTNAFTFTTSDNGKDAPEHAGVWYKLEDDKLTFNGEMGDESDIDSVLIDVDGYDGRDCRGIKLNGGEEAENTDSVCSKDTSITVTLCGDHFGESAQPSASAQ